MQRLLESVNVVSNKLVVSCFGSAAFSSELSCVHSALAKRELKIENCTNLKPWPQDAMPQPAYEVVVWLPLNPYRMVIRHKLLSQLGRISHFLILALSERAFNLEQLAALTALQSVQLLPIHQRLVDLQIIQGERLSRTGQRFAYFLQCLHDKEASFWLDAQYRRAPVLISADHSALVEIPEDAIIVDPAGRSPASAREESTLQLMRLKDADEQCAWLAWLFPLFNNIPRIQDRWWAEWELDLRVPTQSGPSQGIALSGPLVDAALVNEPAVMVCGRLLHLATRYTVPDGLCISGDVAPPSNQDLYFDYFSEHILETPGSFCEEVEFKTQIADSCSEADAMAALKQRVLERPPEDAGMMMLNRQFSTGTHWRAFALSWDDVGQCLEECANNWYVRRSNADR